MESVSVDFEGWWGGKMQNYVSEINVDSGRKKGSVEYEGYKHRNIEQRMPRFLNELT